MNFNTYKSKIDIRKLLIYLNIIDIKELIIPVEIEPDYEISEYLREVDTDYYFICKWSFKNYFENLTNVTFLSHRLYHKDHFEDLDDVLKAKLNSDLIQDNLNIINEIRRDHFRWSGYDSDELEEFKLKNLRLRNIDNVKKDIKYEGTFFGGSYGLTVLEHGECGFYSKIRMEGIRIEGIEKSFIYNDLLGESYLLYLSSNYKLSHFVAYSSFENFLNVKTNSFQVQERVSEKLKKMFKDCGIDIAKNTIYCSIINNFSNQTKIRNDIAHGMETDNLNSDTVNDFLIEILTMIILYEKKFSDFKQLYEQIELTYKKEVKN